MRNPTAGSAVTDVRAATTTDRAATVETAVRAFAVDAAIRSFFPDDAAYDRQATAFYTYLFEKRVAGGEIWMTREAEAISIWEGPAGGTMSRDAVSALWSTATRDMGMQASARLVRYDREVQGHLPDRPYWYLGVLAVHPDHQGRGLSRAVIRPVQERADRDGVPIVLETSEIRNLRLYEYYGFAVIDEFEVAPDVTSWIMERRPGAGSGW